MNTLKWLQQWYFDNCDSDWQHDYGISITTIDNPGWHVCINLKETTVEKKIFQTNIIERSDDDWIDCNVNNSEFNGYGGPFNLEEILIIFFNWITSD